MNGNNPCGSNPYMNGNNPSNSCKEDVLAFITASSDGVTESHMLSAFPHLSKMDVTLLLNELIMSQAIEFKQVGKEIVYCGRNTGSVDHGRLVLDCLAASGSKGLWMKTIKSKTSIPHNYLMKLLRRLEQEQQIRSIKSVNSNKKTYILYDVTPDEEVTGGIWFSNNDVDLEFVNNLMGVIESYVKKRSGYNNRDTKNTRDTGINNRDTSINRDGDTSININRNLVKLSTLPSVPEIYDFLVSNKILEVSLKQEEMETLMDVLVGDKRIMKMTVDYKTVYYGMSNKAGI